MKQKFTLTPADGYAIKAWAAGEATPDQQKRAFALVLRFAGTSDDAFDADNHRLTDYRLGAQSVGRALIAILQSRVTSRRQAASSRPSKQGDLF